MSDINYGLGLWRVRVLIKELCLRHGVGTVPVYTVIGLYVQYEVSSVQCSR